MMDDAFALFGLPRRFALDENALAERYRALAAESHPDRFVSAPAPERQAAMQQALSIDAAHQTLKNPASRARCLLELNGCPVDAENNTLMDVDFLTTQLHWREAADEAKHDPEALDALADQLAADIETRLTRLTDLLDTRHDWPAAKQALFEQLFLEKLKAQIEDAQDALAY
jgi:molecular chaperone HscB